MDGQPGASAPPPPKRAGVPNNPPTIAAPTPAASGAGGSDAAIPAGPPSQAAGKKRPRSEEEPAALHLGSNWAQLKQRLEKSQRRSGPAHVAVHAPGAPAPAPPKPSPAAPLGADAARASAVATLAGPFPADSVPILGDGRRYAALDCEMVGVGPGGVRSALSQVVVVDWLGRVLLNSFVRPPEPVTDYRTHVSGCTAALLRDAPPLAAVQAQVAALLRGKVLVGHGLKNDLRALLLSHPSSQVRDTALHRPFQWRSGEGKWNPKKLKHLVHQQLSLDIQREGVAHEPAEDARAALALYKLHRVEWERGLLSERGGGKGKKNRAASPLVSTLPAAPGQKKKKKNRV